MIYASMLYQVYILDIFNIQAINKKKIPFFL